MSGEDGFIFFCIQTSTKQYESRFIIFLMESETSRNASATIHAFVCVHHLAKCISWGMKSKPMERSAFIEKIVKEYVTIKTQYGRARADVTDEEKDAASEIITDKLRTWLGTLDGPPITKEQAERIAKFASREANSICDEQEKIQREVEKKRREAASAATKET